MSDREGLVPLNPDQTVVKPVKAGKRIPFITLLSIAAAILVFILIIVILVIGGSTITGNIMRAGNSPDNGPGDISKPVLADYSGTWQGRSDDNRLHVIQISEDCNFTHWIKDNSTVKKYTGNWKINSNRYDYRLTYDRGDYFASVKVQPVGDKLTSLMNYEPLCSASEMPMKGILLKKISSGDANYAYIDT